MGLAGVFIAVNLIAAVLLVMAIREVRRLRSEIAKLKEGN